MTYKILRFNERRHSHAIKKQRVADLQDIYVFCIWPLTTR